MSNIFSKIWHIEYLNRLFYQLTDEDRVQADLQGISIRQYAFNKWMDQLERAGDGFKTGFKTKSDGPLPIKLTWWKCWFWWLIPGVFLGTDDRIRFHGWDIGHCLNCDADPYDGQVEAWSYDGNWFRGALIRCNRCGQLRWQPGESGRDY